MLPSAYSQETAVTVENPYAKLKFKELLAENHQLLSDTSWTRRPDFALKQ
jgi:hypothetical protein